MNVFLFFLGTVLGMLSIIFLGGVFVLVGHYLLKRLERYLEKKLAEN